MKYLPIIALLIVIIFINFNKETPLWDMIYYLQSYMYVGFFIYIVWILVKNVVTRSLLISIGLYYFFEFSMDIVNIFNSELYNSLYTTKLINYVLSASIGTSLIFYPIYKSLKKE